MIEVAHDTILERKLNALVNHKRKVTANRCVRWWAFTVGLWTLKSYIQTSGATTHELIASCVVFAMLSLVALMITHFVWNRFIKYHADHKTSSSSTYQEAMSQTQHLMNERNWTQLKEGTKIKHIISQSFDNINRILMIKEFNPETNQVLLALTSDDKLSYKEVNLISDIIDNPDYQVIIL